MLDFRKDRQLRNYLARGERRRLWLIVGAVGLVVVVAGMVQRPGGWRWLGWGGGKGSPAATGRPSIDNRLSVAPPGEDTPTPVVTDGGRPAPAAEDATGRYFPGLKPDYLKLIRDDTFFRSDENEAWLNLLGLLKRSTPEQLDAANPKRVTYAQLFQQSGDFRGELVRVRGILRRAHRLKAVPSEEGIEGFYQTWLFPADSPLSPMIVYCLELPERFPTGMELAEEVEVTGFYFKRKVYVAKDVVRTAPTLLARNVAWLQRPVLSRETARDPSTIVMVVGGALVASLLAIAIVAARTRRRPRPEPATPPDFQALRAAAGGVAAGPPSSDKSPSNSP